MRRFVNWMLAEGILTKDVLAGVVVEQPEAPPVPVFTDDELTALLQACRGSAFNDRRDETILRLFIDCGFAGIGAVRHRR